MYGHLAGLLCRIAAGEKLKKASPDEIKGLMVLLFIVGMNGLFVIHCPFWVGPIIRFVGGGWFGIITFAVCSGILCFALLYAFEFLPVKAAVGLGLGASGILVFELIFRFKEIGEIALSQYRL